MFYSLAPEVAGGLGRDTIMDASKHPPLVRNLHYLFDGWLGDELLESFPCFIVTDGMRRLIESAAPSGCRFGDVKVSTSDGFDELYPARQLPHFAWLKVDGVAGRDDFGISSTGALVVSQRLLEAMQKGVLDHCEIRGL
jgi:hypothetical protein